MTHVDTRGSELEISFLKIAREISAQINRGDVLGLGSGSTVARFANVLGNRVSEESLKISVIPSSMQAWLLAQENRLSTEYDFAHCPAEIDLAVDGADQIGVANRSMIKGGGGALLREKIILSSAKKSYILGDWKKFVRKLDRSVPVEVIQFASFNLEQKIRKNFGAKAELRKLDKGYPFYTESGNIILDCQFSDPIEDPVRLEKELKLLPGVVEVGVFNSKIDRFYKAKDDESFEII